MPKEKRKELKGDSYLEREDDDNDEVERLTVSYLTLWIRLLQSI